MIENHYAKIEDGIVTNVIYASEDFIKTLEGEWIVTSLHAVAGKNVAPEDYVGPEPIRKNFAYIGYLYHREDDAFSPPQPYLGWVLNKESFLWEAPIEYPQDGKNYEWDNEHMTWKEISGVIDYAAYEIKTAPIASQEVQESRLKTCNSCEKSINKGDPINNYCEVCNCEIITRIKYSLKQCPLDKWGKEELLKTPQI